MRNKNLKKKVENKVKTRKWITPDGVRKGIKVVHIGNDVWKFGRQKLIPGKGLHMVIYGPERKEYHIWGQDVYDMCTDINEWGEKDYSNCNRHGNSAIHSKLKIYILTNILDDKSNWCFDLSKIPESGLLKVILKNGTVKNIQFDGNFYPQELISKRFTWEADTRPGHYWPWVSHSTREFVKIVGYRIK